MQCKSISTFIRLSLVIVSLLIASCSFAADGNTAAEFNITTTVLRPAEKVLPLGANDWGKCGAIEWAANNFVNNSGNEPIVWRNMHRAKTVGKNWFEIDGPGTSWYDLWTSGLLSGANVRIYRLVDKDGKPLPVGGSNLDISKADHVINVGTSKVLPEGTKDFIDGGWIANKYANVYLCDNVANKNTACTDYFAVENGRSYWYTVVAVSGDGQESVISNEVNATPKDDIAITPHIVIPPKSNDASWTIKARTAFNFTPTVMGGKVPYTWSALNENGGAFTFSVGMQIDPATGRVYGTPKVVTEADRSLPAPETADRKIWLQVTDANGKSTKCCYIMNPSAPVGDAAAKAKPLPPTNLTAIAENGCVSLSWTASPSANVAAYRIKRSTAPADKQETKVYLEADAPELQPWDYIVFERKFGNFDMKYVNSRIRGMGNADDLPGWYWGASDSKKVSFSLTKHPKPIPADMFDPGESCMQIKVKDGQQSISQLVFIDNNKGGESLWYGQLEPGKKYRLEVWLCQQGLADDGKVLFNYSRGMYSDIKQIFTVTDKWQKFTYDFVGPDRPTNTWHFGHQFTFTGPGTIWMDNCRIFRTDDPADVDKQYVPNATVLNELIASQPEKGNKGAHRTWYLQKDATMSSILSMHSNSNVNVDWFTNIGSTMRMTLPMGLMFDEKTGADAKSRMRPWLVMQHILNSESDWLALVEYLAAPYDDKKDTPQTKPWAYKRYQQRGNSRPWTDEFSSITIEFGNETWHNGFFADWIGFASRNAIHQGGKEYGYFAKYLIDNMKKSPYWKSQNLDMKIRFDLGANYDARVNADGSVNGYGEEAMQTCGEANQIGHANYMGPKWETGDYSARTYDDHGIQETLLSFVSGQKANQDKMFKAQQELGKKGIIYDIAAYEGGPGGYALPGSAKPEQVETNEKYGKSLAMAVGCIDGWIVSYTQGWTDQCFLGYGQGSYWNSHSTFANGFIPSPSWLALTMRNRYASGDLMSVDEKSAPVLMRKTTPLSLTGAYAMRNGSKWSVFVVSRKLEGNHDNFDYGDGTTQVKLDLPFTKANKVTLYTLTGNPRLTNREKQNISIQTQSIPVTAIDDSTLTIDKKTGGSETGMPAGSIFLYVFEGTDTK
ncbi:MAG: Ig domain-containing protein [bacterium]